MCVVFYFFFRIKACSCYSLTEIFKHSSGRNAAPWSLGLIRISYVQVTKATPKVLEGIEAVFSMAGRSGEGLVTQTALLHHVVSQEQEKRARLVANPIVINTLPRVMRSTPGPQELSL